MSILEARRFEAEDVGDTATEGALLWFAVRTKARQEKRVAADLGEKAIQTYLPLWSVEHRWSDRRKLVKEPLFPGYVFVKIPQTAQARVPVLQTNGVSNFLGVRGVGIPVPDEEIKAVQQILREGIPVEPHPFLQVGQRVRICGGSFDGMEGLLTSMEGKQNLVISIEVISRSVAIRISGYKVVPVDELSE